MSLVKEIILKTYEIYFSLTGSAVINIEANSAEHAEELLFDHSTDNLIEMVDFKRGLKIYEIDGIEHLDD